MSILTPVSAHANSEFLQSAYDSLAGSDVPAGWEVEWLIQEDGDSRRHQEWASTLALPHGRVAYAANGKQFGAATTRTAAFVRSEGEVVFGLDADDLLSPGGLSALLHASDTNHRSAHWIVGQSMHMIDGKAKKRECGFAPGQVERGEVSKAWERTGIMPFPVTPVLLRSRTVWRFGGWPAIARSEDASLMFAVSELFAGAVIPDQVYVYRKWPGQSRAENWWAESRDLAYRHRRKWVSALRDPDYLSSIYDDD